MSPIQHQTEDLRRPGQSQESSEFFFQEASSIGRREKDEAKDFQVVFWSEYRFVQSDERCSSERTEVHALR